MTSAKDVILHRIRAAVDGSPEPAVAEPAYRQSDALDLHLFEDRLIDYGVRVYACRNEGVRDTIAEALSNAGKRRMLIPPGLDRDILPEGFAFQVDDALSYEELDRAEGVLTPCAVAVAETGTLILRHGESQ